MNPNRNLEKEFSQILSEMISWFISAEHDSALGYLSKWGPDSVMNYRTIFDTARALNAIYAAYPHVLPDYVFKEEEKKISIDELKEEIEGAKNWLIRCRVYDVTGDSIFWWSGDNTPIEITRSTCAALNALMEYREVLLEKRVELLFEKSRKNQNEREIEELNKLIEQGINWIIANITPNDAFVENSITADQTILYSGGLSNIPQRLHHALIHGKFPKSPVADYDAGEVHALISKGVYSSKWVRTVGMACMGEDFEGLCGKVLELRFDPWATAECLFIVTRQYEFNKRNSSEGHIVRNVGLVSAAEKMIHALRTSQDRHEMWESRFACANSFIIYSLLFAFHTLGESYVDYRTLIDEPLKYICRLILKGSHTYHEKPISDNKVYKAAFEAATDLRDLCIAFGLVLCQLLRDRPKQLSEFSWFYQNLSQFIGKRPFKVYSYVPSTAARVDKTSWAALCIVEILKHCGLNRRRLRNRKKWALRILLGRTIEEVIPSASATLPEVYSTFKLFFVPAESQYHYFDFTHKHNLKALKEVLNGSKRAIRWIDLGCGNGRNLDIVKELSKKQRQKIDTINGLDYRENLEQEFNMRFKKLFPDEQKNPYTIADLAKFKQREAFDFATATLLLHEIPLDGFLESLKNALNCLKNHGTLVLVDIIDYYTTEMGIVAWDKDDVKSILDLFSSFVKIEPTVEEQEEITTRHETRHYRYYHIVVRKLRSIKEISQEQRASFIGILKRKMQKLIDDLNSVNKRLQQKIEDLNKAVEIQVTTQRDVRIEMERLVDSEDLIGKVESADVQNCLRSFQLNRQIRNISKYLDEYKNMGA